MKIIFIGVHNKKGVKPLDSSTPSGQKIDAVIKNFPSVSSIKINLFDVDYMPLSQEAEVLKYKIFERVSFMHDDVIVCLGSTVWEYLKEDFSGYSIIKYYHPSPLNSAIRGRDYVAELTALIKKAILINQLAE